MMSQLCSVWTNSFSDVTYDNWQIQLITWRKIKEEESKNTEQLLWDSHCKHVNWCPAQGCFSLWALVQDLDPKTPGLQILDSRIPGLQILDSRTPGLQDLDWRIPGSGLQNYRLWTPGFQGSRILESGFQDPSPPSPVPQSGTADYLNSLIHFSLIGLFISTCNWLIV